MRWLVVMGAVAAIAAPGCAHTSVPTDRIAASTAAIRRARETGAPAVSTAALHLRLAEEQYQAAQRSLAEGDNERAAFMLYRAESDANLAVALAREASDRAEAATMAERVRSLQDDVSRTTGQGGPL